MRIAIIDDNDYERTLNETLITEAFHELHLPIFQIDLFRSGEEFLESWKVGSYDLILLDILMDTTTGIDIAHQIRKKNHDIRIVFCSSSNEYACESYAVNASYYLQKPATKEGILNMVKRLNIFDYELRRFIVLPDNQKLLLRNIIYSEYSNHLISVHMKSGDVMKIWDSQKNFIEQLKDYPFLLPCNQGNIVNLYEVDHIEQYAFILVDDSYIPISRRKYKEVEEKYQDFLFHSVREVM